MIFVSKLTVSFGWGDRRCEGPMESRDLLTPGCSIQEVELTQSRFLRHLGLRSRVPLPRAYISICFFEWGYHILLVSKCECKMYHANSYEVMFHQALFFKSLLPTQGRLPLPYPVHGHWRTSQNFRAALPFQIIFSAYTFADCSLCVRVIEAAIRRRNCSTI